MDKDVLIAGDFNICYMKNKTNKISKMLENEGFQQLVQHPTHIQGGHIDHVYWRGGERIGSKTATLERYSPYYSDHDASLITLEGKNNLM